MYNTHRHSHTHVKVSSDDVIWLTSETPHTIAESSISQHKLYNVVKTLKRRNNFKKYLAIFIEFRRYVFIVPYLHLISPKAHNSRNLFADSL